MKKKIIIPAFALLIGTALAGSITGTAAWYQYSTKVNGALIGVAGGATGNLNMRIRQDNQAADAGWTTFLSKETIRSFLTENGYGTNIQPVTLNVDENGLDKDGALAVSPAEPDFRLNPTPGVAGYSNWKAATKANYVVIPLQLRYVKQGNNGLEYLAEKVYLSDLVLAQRTTGGATNDISNALRFHVSAGSTNRLISNEGGTTVTNGKLDLDGDGSPDKAKPNANDKYGFNSEVDTTTEITYGAGSQVSYAKSAMLATHRDGKNGDDLVDTSATDAKLIGTTSDNSSSYLNVDITIWVEGWHQFSSSSIWSEKFIGSDFNIGFEFAVNAETDPAQQTTQP